MASSAAHALHRRLLSLPSLVARMFAPVRGRLATETGQGTVEYVALILLVAGVLAGVVAAANSFGGADIGQTVVDKLESAIKDVGGNG